MLPPFLPYLPKDKVGVLLQFTVDRDVFQQVFQINNIQALQNDNILTNMYMYMYIVGLYNMYTQCIICILAKTFVYFIFHSTFPEEGQSRLGKRSRGACLLNIAEREVNIAPSPQMKNLVNGTLYGSWTYPEEMVRFLDLDVHVILCNVGILCQQVNWLGCKSNKRACALPRLL